jgi:hypothetical protein
MEVDERLRERIFQDSRIEIVPFDMTLDYQHWSADHVLRVCSCT